MTTTPTKLPLTLLVGLGLVGVLAGCSAPVETPADEPAETETETETETAPEPEAAPSGTYADGDYSAAGEYQAPSGTESVEVSVTLEGDVITAVTVVGDSEDAQARGYQQQFIAGIGAIAVGQNIDDLQVDKVGGSSLTGGGFNAALATIKADAAN
jgi:uncharacterized protein with FMN-binding domain